MRQQEGHPLAALLFLCAHQKRQRPQEQQTDKGSTRTIAQSPNRPQRRAAWHTVARDSNAQQRIANAMISNPTTQEALEPYTEARREAKRAEGRKDPGARKEGTQGHWRGERGKGQNMSDNIMLLMRG